jgi:hypothetical protein
MLWNFRAQKPEEGFPEQVTRFDAKDLRGVSSGPLLGLGEHGRRREGDIENQALKTG